MVSLLLRRLLPFVGAAPSIARIAGMGTFVEDAEISQAFTAQTVKCGKIPAGSHCSIKGVTHRLVDLYGVRRPERKSTMKTYVACIGGEAVLAFRAEDEDDARAMIVEQEGGVRSDLEVLIGSDGKPLWDGKSAIQAEEATAAQHAEWEQSRDQAIGDEEIDLDSGDNPDEWNVYLNRNPQTK